MAFCQEAGSLHAGRLQADQGPPRLVVRSWVYAAPRRRGLLNDATREVSVRQPICADTATGLDIATIWLNQAQLFAPLYNANDVAKLRGLVRRVGVEGTSFV